MISGVSNRFLQERLKERVVVHRVEGQIPELRTEPQFRELECRRVATKGIVRIGADPYQLFDQIGLWRISIHFAEEMGRMRTDIVHLNRRVRNPLALYADIPGLCLRSPVFPVKKNRSETCSVLHGCRGNLDSWDPH